MLTGSHPPVDEESRQKESQKTSGNARKYDGLRPHARRNIKPNDAEKEQDDQGASRDVECAAYPFRSRVGHVFDHSLEV